MARVGLGSQAIVYLVLAWLTAEIAAGGGDKQANQKGALAEVIRHPGGVVLIVVMTAGFACYSLWRLSEAVFGSTVNHTRTDRALSEVRAIVYGTLCVSTALFLAGSRDQDQAQQPRQVNRSRRRPADPRRTAGGPWLLGLVGLGFAAFALYVAAAARWIKT
jgi:Domain of Unknown Function (DUF1206)